MPSMGNGGRKGRQNGIKAINLAPIRKPQSEAELRDHLEQYFQSLCQSCENSSSHLPFPSIALSSSVIQDGRAYWRQALLQIISPLKVILSHKEPSKFQMRLKSALFLLLYYFSTDPILASMMILEDIVHVLVQETCRHCNLRATTPPSDTKNAHHSAMDSTISVDYLWYTNQSLCHELFACGQLEHILPLGAKSMLHVLGGRSLPRSEVEEYDLIVVGSSEKNQDVSDQQSNELSLALIISESVSFQLHLLVRIFTSLFQTCSSQNHFVERKRLIQDGGIEALVFLSTPMEFNLDAANNKDILSILNPQFTSRMARQGLFNLPESELRRVISGQHIQPRGGPPPMHQDKSTEIYSHCHAVLENVLGERVNKIRSTIKQIERRPSSQDDTLAGRLAAVQVASQSEKPTPPLKQVPKEFIIKWVRRAHEVSQHLLAGFPVLQGTSKILGEDVPTMAEWLAQAQKERALLESKLLLEKKAAEEIRRSELENELMASEDKKPETESERRQRLLEKQREFERWQEAKRHEQELHVLAIVQRKAEEQERVRMNKEDIAWMLALKKHEPTHEDELALENERIEKLRLKIREERRIENESKTMRSEDNLARQIRKAIWDEQNARYRAQVEREAMERQCMRKEEELINKKLWKAIDEHEEDLRLQAKLDERKRQRAAERRKRRQAEHPELYAKEWEKVPLEDTPSAHYYYNTVTGEVQWDDPTVKKIPVEDAWSTAQDENGNTYYVNSVSGESSWTPPAKFAQSVWCECFSDTGVVYYYNTQTGESTWEKPA